MIVTRSYKIVAMEEISSILQRYTARKIDELHFSFRSQIELVKLAALFHRASMEKSHTIWLSDWQCKMVFLACYKLGSSPATVAYLSDHVYAAYPEISIKYPLSQYHFKL